MGKIAITLVIAIIAIIFIVITAIYINHRVKLNNESNDHQFPGELIEVNGNQIHVYQAGSGDETLVFLSGHGTAYPTLDFKPLWSQFTDEYNIIIIERFGYGYSDITNTPRDIETILEETRTALSQTNKPGPYIVFGHSMAGLEAIYWAQQYPDEVQAIIGLDPLIPTAVDLLPKVSQLELKLTQFMSRVGLSRLMPEEELSNNLPLLQSDILTEDEKLEYKHMFYKRSLTTNMIKEFEYLSKNKNTLNDANTPYTIPMFFFISSEQNTAVDGWSDAIIEYSNTLETSNYFELSTSHYIHHEKSETIATETLQFLEGLNQD